jgi:hypothetical protein
MYLDRSCGWNSRPGTKYVEENLDKKGRKPRLICTIKNEKLQNKWYFVNKIVLTYCEKKLF